MQEACMSSGTNWPTRFAEMVDFVGLSEEDRQLIKASAPLIMAHAERLNDVVWIEANKQTMISWLRASASAPSNEGFVRYLVAISQMHRNIPIHRPHLGPVAPRYIIGVISYYQTALAELLHQHLSDTALASRTSMAWNKWLMVSLELLLAEYLAHNGDD
jgi:hypothetical protein